MRKQLAATPSSIGWAVLVLALAIASLALAFLMAENNQLTERVVALEAAMQLQDE